MNYEHIAIAPLIVAGAISGLSSLASSWFGSNSQQKANQANVDS